MSAASLKSGGSLGSSTFQYSRVTPEMIMRSREWVSSLKLGHYLD
jgi:hypothetical protein